MKVRSQRKPETKMGIHKIYRSPRETKPQKGLLRFAPKPPDEREERIPPPAQLISPKGWQRERLQRLARICRCLDRGQAAGRQLGKMLTRFVWVWRDRHYTCEPARRIRFSYGTLRRLHYTWVNGGSTPDALTLGYSRGNRRASKCQVMELAKLCLARETPSFSAAYRKLKSPGVTESAYRHATPARLRAAVAALLAHRRHEQVLEQAARKLLGEVPK